LAIGNLGQFIPTRVRRCNLGVARVAAEGTTVNLKQKIIVGLNAAAPLAAFGVVILVLTH
jgi:hypothetical protein